MKHVSSFILLALSVMLFGNLKSQPTFFLSYDTPGEAVASGSHVETSNGGRVILSHVSSAGGQAALLYRTDAAGTVLWEKHIPLAATVQGVSNVARSTDSSCFFVLNENLGPLTIVRVDAAGNIVFSKAVSLPAGYTCVQTAVCFARNDGSFLVSTTLMDQNAWNYVWLVMNVDHNGVINWSTEFNREQKPVYQRDMDTCSNGDIVLLGNWRDDPALASGPCISRITAAGTLVWSKATFLASSHIQPVSICVMPGDFIFVSGFRYYGQTSTNITYMSRYTPQGDEIWTMTYSALDLCVQDILSSNHNLLIAGTSQTYSSFVIEIDSSGNTQWSNLYANTSIRDIEHSSLGGYTTNSMGSPAGLDFLGLQANGSSCVQDTTFSVLKTPVTIYQTITGTDSTLELTAAPVALIPDLNPIVVSQYCFTNSIEEKAVVANVLLYPNPATESITVQSTEDIRQINVFNAGGSLVQQEQINSRNCQVDIRSLPAGLYVITIETDKGVESVRFTVL